METAQYTWSSKSKSLFCFPCKQQKNYPMRNGFQNIVLCVMLFRVTASHVHVSTCNFKAFVQSNSSTICYYTKELCGTCWKAAFIYCANSSKAKLFRYRHAGATGESIYSLYSLLTSALDEVGGQHYVQTALYPRSHWIGGWVGLRAGLDTEASEKIPCLCRGSSPGRLVCSQKPY
jgi:hypothetical protein